MVQNRKKNIWGGPRVWVYMFVCLLFLTMTHKGYHRTPARNSQRWHRWHRTCLSLRVWLRSNFVRCTQSLFGALEDAEISPTNISWVCAEIRYSPELSGIYQLGLWFLNYHWKLKHSWHKLSLDTHISCSACKMLHLPAYMNRISRPQNEESHCIFQEEWRD